MSGDSAEAREQMQPLLDSAAEMRGQAIELKEELNLLKRRKADRSTLDALASKLKETQKEARDLESKAAAIDPVVYERHVGSLHIRFLRWQRWFRLPSNRLAGASYDTVSERPSTHR